MCTIIKVCVFHKPKMENLDGTKQGILLKQGAKDMLKKCH